MEGPANNGGYGIDFDPVGRRLSLRLHGFWSDEIADAFGHELHARITAAAVRTPHFDTLSDASAFAVQSAGVSAKFAGIMHSLGKARRGRIAIVVASTLNKLQVERALGSRLISVFLDAAAASRWLDTPDETPLP